MGRPEPKPGGAPVKKKSGFFARWTKRFLVLAVLGAAALVAGFKVERGAWAWQDAPGFEGYAQAKWDCVREKAVAYAHMAKQKADESGLTAKTEELIERAKRALSTEDAEPAPEPAKEPAAAGTTPIANPAPKADPAEVAAKGEVPPEYPIEYKAGLEAYRAGLVHFRDSQPHSSNEQRELRAAKEKFQAARDHWQKAAALYDKDARLGEMQTQLNQYLLDCNKRLKPVY